MKTGGGEDSAVSFRCFPFSALVAFVVYNRMLSI